MHGCCLNTGVDIEFITMKQLQKDCFRFINNTYFRIYLSVTNLYLPIENITSRPNFTANNHHHSRIQLSIFKLIWIWWECKRYPSLNTKLLIIPVNYISQTNQMDLGIIEKLAKCIVRPPKATYDIENLVPPCFQMKHRLYERSDFTVLNNRGLKIQGTLIKDHYQVAPRDTIVFLHANGSSRLIMKNYLDILLPIYDVVSFDFAGCGLSEGQFITLGYNEREDVYSVINYLRKERKITNFILWGRSMGAATALLYTAKYGGINAIISDNSYSDLQVLINQLSDDYLPFLPTFLLDGIIDSIQQFIQKVLWKTESTDFNIRKLKPINMVQKIQCPIMYIGSKDDTFVNVNHTKALFNKTKSSKHLELVNGNHNDVRSQEIKQKMLKFLQQNAKTSNSDSNSFFLQIREQNKIEQDKKERKKNLPSPLEVQLVNCAEIQFQSQNQQPKHNKQQSSAFMAKVSTVSNPEVRQGLMSRQSKAANKMERSRSKIKRKKIFEGIEYISEHLNGWQN